MRKSVRVGKGVSLKQREAIIMELKQNSNAQSSIPSEEYRETLARKFKTNVASIQNIEYIWMNMKKYKRYKARRSIHGPRMNPFAVVPIYSTTTEESEDASDYQDEDETVVQQHNNMPLSTSRTCELKSNEPSRKRRRFSEAENPKKKVQKTQGRLPPKKKWLQQWRLHLQQAKTQV